MQLCVSSLTIVAIAAVWWCPTVEAAGQGTVGAYSTNNEQQDKRLTGCLLTSLTTATGGPNSVQACYAQCQSRAASCAAFAFSANEGKCELSTGWDGTGPCALTDADGWVAFKLTDFNQPNPQVGVCLNSAGQCQNNGVCLSRTEQVGGSYVCACPAGFSGPQCTTTVTQPTWSTWSAFSACSVTCGLGMRLRSRSCKDPAGSLVATMAACGPESTDFFEECTNSVCPTWSVWSSWSTCNTTSTCGPGVRQRSRTCQNGGVIGKDCKGSALQSTPCNSGSCSIQAAPLSLNPVIIEPAIMGKGYVQIYSDTYGTAGYVCSDGFDNDAEGAVVCRTLGFDGVQAQPAASSLPPMPVPATYFLTNLQCKGTEQSLQSCEHSPWSNATTCASGRAAYVLCKVNGRWSPWDPWESCEGKCGSALRNRNRTCTKPMPLGGLACSGLGFQEAPCPSLSPCPVNGAWSQWSDWNSCTAQCGGGTRSRSRVCVQPQNGGADCIGSGEEISECNEAPCPVDGYYEPWSDWAACNVTCGGGVQVRIRLCVPPAHSGKPCEGPASEVQSCSLKHCPVSGAWSLWDVWSSCSATCGGGTSSRSRLCNNPAPNYGGDDCVGKSSESQACNTFSCPVDGVLSPWSSYSACSASCGGGNQNRQRTCIGPLHNGAPCVGPLSETATCNSQPCPVNGQWSTWSSWAACNVTCGGGYQQRIRQCNNPAPDYGGRNCSGSAFDSTACAENSCPVNGNYNTWSAWSACSHTCGGGTSVRNRTCVPPLFGGLPCRGPANETAPCMTQQCPIPGEWLGWQSWGHCSQTCAGGVRIRIRECNMTSYGALTIACVGMRTDSGPCNADKECTAVRRCQDLKDNGLNYDMVTTIDPDGPTGPVMPFSVTCQLSQAGNLGYTVVNTTGMTLPGIYAHGSEAGGSIHIKVGYQGGATASALNSLARISQNCSQYVRYTCRDAGIHYQNNVYLQATYWVNFQFQQMLGFGQPFHLRHKSVCACFATGSCGTLTTNVDGVDTVMQATCNCDRNERVDGIFDEGTIFDKNNLPVNEVWVGDTGDDTEWSFTFVGPLVCWGQDPSVGKK